MLPSITIYKTVKVTWSASLKAVEVITVTSRSSEDDGGVAFT